MESYQEYIKARASVGTLLADYYGDETLAFENVYFSEDRCFQFNVTRKGDLYFGKLFVVRIRGHYPQPESLPDLPTRLQIYGIYIGIMLQQSHISERLTDDGKDKLVKLTILNNSELKQNVNTILQKIQLIPFRKLKMASKTYHKQNDNELVKKIIQKFGKEYVLILRILSAPNVKIKSQLGVLG
ncbi:hypothetical protein G6F56_011652 [Rhizopus delemar]|nr:hypothetical protein G6F56_011652 [Rhizopus delemar]